GHPPPGAPRRTRENGPAARRPAPPKAAGIRGPPKGRRLPPAWMALPPPSRGGVVLPLGSRLGKPAWEAGWLVRLFPGQSTAYNNSLPARVFLVTLAGLSLEKPGRSGAGGSRICPRPFI